MKYIGYTVRVDGNIITRINLPIIMSASKREEVRAGIAVTYQIPRHYIRLQPEKYKVGGHAITY